MNIVTTIEAEIQAFAQFVKRIDIEKTSVFDSLFHDKLNHINELSLSVPDKRPELMKYLYETCFEKIDKGMMQTRGRHKPSGHPGDFRIIDWIYTKRMASNGTGRRWDEFYHRQAAPQAVRNRKDYFCQIFNRLYNEAGGSISVLNLGCGPCRDVAEEITKTDGNTQKIHFHCVDMDDNALTYAKEIVNASPPEASFQWETTNVFRMRPSICYDLVWSAGLFDYLSDRQAILLLKKMWRWTRDGGRIIFGNFHPQNPTRNYMEWAGDWFLVYRTGQEMRSLCEQAGISQDCVSFDQEPLGINIFCSVRKK